MVIDGFRFDRTSLACPEQYDVYKDGKQVGYLRLRHGCFTVYYPYCGGELVYQNNPKGDGIFESYEREYYLKEAIGAIQVAMSKYTSD